MKSLLGFLKSQKPDFVAMQEVTSGWMNFGIDKNLNIFEYIKRELGYHGVFCNDVSMLSHPDSLHGNAILSRYPIVASKQVILKKFRPISDEEFVDSKIYPDFPRSILDATLNLGGQELHVLSVHGAWTAPPTDTPETMRQANIIANHLKSIHEPYILGGDLNTTADKKVIGKISAVSNNLMTGSGITRSLHPVVHKVAEKELLVDYIFTSGDFRRVSISAPTVLISDHLPVVAELEL